MSDNNRPATATAAANMDQMGLRQGMGPQHAGAPKIRSSNATVTLLRIWNYLQHQRLALLWVVLCTIITTGLSLLAPYLIGKLFDKHIVPGRLDGIAEAGMALLLVYALSALFTWMQQYTASGLSQNTVRDMRQHLFDHYQQLPVPFFDSKTHGELMSRAVNDITNVSNSLNQTVIQLVSGALMLGGSTVMMFALSWRMALVTILTIPLIIFITKKITGYTRLFFSRQQAVLGEVNGYVQENISGLKVVKAFAREDESIARFRELNEQLRTIGVRAQSLSGSMGPMMNTMRNITFLIIAVFGAWFAYYDLVTIGIIVSFLNYSNQFSQPLNQLANQYNLLQAAIAGAERVFEVLDLEPEYGNEEIRSLGETVRGEVVFDRVVFGYKPGVPVLREVSLHAQPGQTIALVGPTGAGKTTIINLLTRFYEINAGSIRLDGQDIRELDKRALRQQIGLVLQDAYVFTGTIRDNIRFGRLDATAQEIEEAARLANADSFIRKLPEGYDTIIHPEGGRLSQGQRQLLTIARAVLANPSILILDEATSSVDTRTELHIQEAMRTLMQGRTSFIIAHRLSTIKEADAILVIKDGHIIEQGAHDELLLQDGFYAELYNSQFTRDQAS